MNIVEQFERIKFWLDIVASPRFDVTQVENAINDAAYQLVDTKYNSAPKQMSMDSFQRTQKVRDQLSNLVGKPQNLLSGGSPIVENGINRFTVSLITETRYRYLLSLRVIDSNSNYYPGFETTYNGKNLMSSSPYRRPRSTFFGKVYYNEEGYSTTEKSSRINIYTPLSITQISVELFYLKNPIQAKWGNEYTNSKQFVAGNIVIPTSTTVYLNQTYLLGQQFAIASTPLNIASGTVLFDHIETDLNVQLHESLCRMAALNLLLTTRDIDRHKELKERMMLDN